MVFLKEWSKEGLEREFTTSRFPDIDMVKSCVIKAIQLMTFETKASRWLFKLYLLCEKEWYTRVGSIDEVLQSAHPLTKGHIQTANWGSMEDERFQRVPYHGPCAEANSNSAGVPWMLNTGWSDRGWRLRSPSLRLEARDIEPMIYESRIDECARLAAELRRSQAKFSYTTNVIQFPGRTRTRLVPRPR